MFDPKSAPKEEGIVVIAVLFGFIGGGVALVLYDYAWTAAAVIAILVATVVALVLWLGWREPASKGQVGPGLASTDDKAADATHHERDASEATHTAPATSAAMAPAASSISVDPDDASSAAGSTGAIETADAPGHVVTTGSAAAAPVTTPAPSKATDPEQLAEGSEAQDDAQSKPAGTPKTAPTPSESAPLDAPAETGIKPAGLEAPRGGQADNLKEIKGVGVKLEQLLHDMGYYHFDQIAQWTEVEIAWVDENLKGFRGRVTRDDWVPQAKILADGGDTDFSKKVDKGRVY